MRRVLFLSSGGCLLLTAAETRSSASLGASTSAFSRIFTNQIELGLLFGSNLSQRIVQAGVLQSDSTVVLMTVFGLAACVMAAWRGPSLFRMFALFGVLVLAASLATPVVTPGVPAWKVLAWPGSGQRYFLIPMLVLAAAGIVLASDRLSGLRGVGVILCLTVLIGIAGDWSYPRMAATDFNSLARRFAVLPRGTEIAFPLYPPGVASMILIKR